jgi:uncharacterized protein YlbG (UPF0298 family)
MIPERCGLIVWLHHLKAIKVLERFGTLHYVSRRMKYAVLYVNRDQLEQTINDLTQLNFVKKIEKSYRHEIKTEYNSEIPDKTRFYM